LAGSVSCRRNRLPEPVPTQAYLDYRVEFPYRMYLDKS
jgi:hypothetical protein